jgi:hypothetical protein
MNAGPNKVFIWGSIVKLIKETAGNHFNTNPKSPGNQERETIVKLI